MESKEIKPETNLEKELEESHDFEKELEDQLSVYEEKSENDSEKELEEISKDIESKEIENKNKFKYLVISGGGMYGISFIGAIKYLEEIEINEFEEYCGVSAGSMVSLLSIIGVGYKELYNFYMNYDLNKLVDIDLESILENYGLLKGNKIIKLLSIFMKYKKINPEITMKELYELTSKKLIIGVTNLTKIKGEYISYENYPDMPVLLAIKASISAPFLFEPLIYNGNYYVDGGISDNFPMHLYKGEKEKYTIGMKIYSDYEKCEIKSLLDYCEAIRLIIFKTIEHIPNIGLENIIYIKTDEIDGDFINFINFEMEKEVIKKMLNIGYEAAKSAKFLKI